MTFFSICASTNYFHLLLNCLRQWRGYFSSIYGSVCVGFFLKRSLCSLRHPPPITAAKLAAEATARVIRRRSFDWLSIQLYTAHSLPHSPSLSSTHVLAAASLCSLHSQLFDLAQQLLRNNNNNIIIIIIGKEYAVEMLLALALSLSLTHYQSLSKPKWKGATFRGKWINLYSHMYVCLSQRQRLRPYQYSTSSTSLSIFSIPYYR